MVDGLTRDDSSQIGFVTACLFSEAITLDDLHNWCVHLISQHDVADLPSYVFELVDFDGYLKDIYETIGFSAGFSRTPSEDLALQGLAVLRGRQPYELHVSPAQAVSMVAQHPEILARFREVFPFIEVNMSE